MYKRTALLNMVILFLSAFVSCDSATNTIFAKCCLCEDTLTLGFKAEKMYAGGNHTYFLMNATLQEIREEIEKIEIKEGILCTELYENCIFIKKVEGHSTHYYTVLQEGLGSYSFFSPNKSIKSKGSLLFPFHLLDASEDENWWYGEEFSYELEASVEELIAFYEESNVYEIEQTEKGFVFIPKRDVEFEKKYSDSSFCLKIEEKDNGSKVCTYYFD